MAVSQEQTSCQRGGMIPTNMNLDVGWLGAGSVGAEKIVQRVTGNGVDAPHDFVGLFFEGAYVIPFRPR